MDDLEKASLYHIYRLTAYSLVQIKRIKSYFGSFFNAWQAGREEWANIISEPAKIDALTDAIKRINLNESWERLCGEHYDMVFWGEEHYPSLLREIPRAPCLLFYRGNLDVLKNLSIAIVGSRKATAYGKKIAWELAQRLSEAEVTVVSGMARGIDSEAHFGALEGQGATVAILGSGIDVVYPRENGRLYERIQEKGAIISEFYAGTPPEASNFPRRNRIISGLSRGVAVIEAQAKSGALITVDFALEQGRDVFSVPGPITSANSAGTNQLIQQGAKLISCAEDILEDYLPPLNEKRTHLRQPSLLMLDRNEQEILQYMSYDPIHMDDIVMSTGIEIGLVSTLLLSLELAGLIASLPGNYYVKV